MESRRYPEQNRRRELLRGIHEWTEAQPDAEPLLGLDGEDPRLSF